VRGRFDPDTQGFNLDFDSPPSPPKIKRLPFPPPTGEASVAPAPIVAEAPRSVARSTATRSITSKGVKKYNKLPTKFREQNEAIGREKFFLGDKGQVRRKLLLAPKPAAPAFVIPTRQGQLPTTREGFDKDDVTKGKNLEKSVSQAAKNQRITVTYPGGEVRGVTSNNGDVCIPVPWTTGKNLPQLRVTWQMTVPAGTILFNSKEF
jgi:hypothetical protein